MLSGRVADAAAPDIESVAAHAPMVNLPGHHSACHNGVAEWAPVGHPLVSENDDDDDDDDDDEDDEDDDDDDDDDDENMDFQMIPFGDIRSY